MRWLSRAKSLPVLTGFSVVVTIPSLPGRGRPGNPECPRHIPGACPTPESGIGARNDQPTYSARWSPVTVDRLRAGQFGGGAFEYHAAAAGAPQGGLGCVQRTQGALRCV